MEDAFNLAKTDNILQNMIIRGNTRKAVFWHTSKYSSDHKDHLRYEQGKEGESLIRECEDIGEHVIARLE